MGVGWGGERRGGYEAALHHLKSLVGANGHLLIGEPYYESREVPEALVEYEGQLGTVDDLLGVARSVGCELEYMVTSTNADWERYICSGWHDILLWLDDNPDHPERTAVIEQLHRGQDMYLKYRRQYQGFVLQVLRPKRYE